jgi:hypothetical protein
LYNQKGTVPRDDLDVLVVDVDALQPQDVSRTMFFPQNIQEQGRNL